jgi:predicted 3-demethylubiquinone-9 3-methyltransferase (glyoxalase superfamily)
MQKITPHLWFDKEAREAAGFYTSLFPDSRITSTMTLPDTPSGDTDIISFELAGLSFMAISAGPLFKFNPSVSFFVNFDPSRDKNARENLDKLWDSLSQGGMALMPLQQYPFSEHYGWVQDKYGLSWQLILSNPEGEERPFIVPSLLFVGDVAGHAGEAINHYLSIFKDSLLGSLQRYGAGQEPDQEGTVMYADFMLAGQWFAAMDSAQKHEFGFNEAISFIVNCETQAEIDYYWDRLSAVPEAEQCGWLKDRFGLSWQVAPTAMDEMMQSGTREQIARVTEAFLQMKKFDLAELQKAYEGK